MVEGTQRRLAAIVSADVVGYSRLMGVDETGTLAALRAHRTELIDPLIIEYGGRIVKTMGDGLLLEFPSVVDATQCVLKIQKNMVERNANIDESLRITFRIGVNLGDIIIDGDDIHGDGVNIAARLQEISEPGGISISRRVHDDVQDRLDAPFEDTGEQTLKNITRPLQVWRWSPTIQQITSNPTSNTEPLSLPDKPSIAVLPFDNMSNDSEQDYFSDGISEDIITNLSRIRWLFVIARNSSFVFKGRAVEVRQVAEELGVLYVLEGSVRKAGNRVRITAQLIDARTSDHIWAERYDRNLTDIFAVQDEITESVAGAIEPAILAAEGLRARERSESDLGAWNLVMQAVSSFWHMSKEDSQTAMRLLKTATERYPQYGAAHSMLGFIALFSSQMGWADLSIMREFAEKLAQRAFDLDDQDPWAHITLGYLHTMKRNTESAVREFSIALDLNPNFAAAYGWRGFAKAHAGLSDDAIEDINTALRLSPKDPQNAIFVGGLGLSHFLANRYEEAQKFAEESIRLRSGFVAGHRMRCAALARSGKLSEAREVLKDIKNLQPNVSAALLRSTLPYPSSENLEKFIGGLVLAGLPE